jgi:hypothetical protein
VTIAVIFFGKKILLSIAGRMSSDELTNGAFGCVGRGDSQQNATSVADSGIGSALDVDFQRKSNKPLFDFL